MGFCRLASGKLTSYAGSMTQYIVGHRGAMGEAPENTLKSFRIGCESIALLVECDVHLSKDGEIMVFHDDTLERTTGGSGWLREHPMKELRRLDAGQGERIPTLVEVVNLVKQYQKKLIVEVKGESEEIALETTEQLARFIKQEQAAGTVLMHSFWHCAVKRFKVLFPDISASIIMMVGLKPADMIQLIENAHADGASIAYDYISPELVALAKSKNYILDAWVLNTPATFERMKEIGVNGLITNYPSRFSLKGKWHS